MSAPTLRLSRGSDAWYVDYVGTPEAQHIRDLFGATKIPTPYTPSAAAETVRAAIARRNPQYVIQCD